LKEEEEEEKWKNAFDVWNNS